MPRLSRRRQVAAGRVFGLETEFGCLVRGSGVGNAEDVVNAVKDQAFDVRRLGIMDLHSRDNAFEPAGAGGFLRNGGRLYIDMVGSHEEYATPECSSLDDLITYDRAGRALLQSLLRDLGLDGQASFHNNSVDHFGGHTFGCHENYLIRVTEGEYMAAILQLLPFLITRQVYAGVGRVGGHRLVRPDSDSNVMTLSDHAEDYIWVNNFYGVEIDPTVDFQLSQRADHIVRAVSTRVRFNRSIINPKWDAGYEYDGANRLHVLFGEANQSEYAAKLKVGTTSLVLDLIEAGAAPTDLDLEEPLIALRTISRDLTFRQPVPLRSGETMRPIAIQYRYLAAAEAILRDRDDQTNWVLDEWARTLADLERDPMLTADRLDWSSKLALYQEYMAGEGVGWQDDMLQSLDLEYHNIDPEASLHSGLEEAGVVVRLTQPEAVREAMFRPPGSTRAYGRGTAVAYLADHPGPLYVVDWGSVHVEGGHTIEMPNPLNTYHREVERILGRLR